MERLVESDSYEHYNGTASYLLYTSESAIFPFVKYEKQLAEINDYCIYLLKCLKEKILEAEAEAQKANDQHIQKAEFLNYQYGKILQWKFLYQDINKYTMLLLLLAFFESTLNEIANWFSDIAGYTSDWKKIRNPKVSDYICQIGICCGTDLRQKVAAELAYYDVIRKIRNQFIHNEWDQLTDQYEQFVLADVINMISHVILIVEKSALGSGLIG